MRRLYMLAALSLYLLLFPVPALTAQSYTVTDLGTFGGSQTLAFGIDEAGDVVGSANLTCEACYSHAFLYKNGKLRDLGALPGATVSAGYGISGGRGEGRIRATGYSYTQPCVHSDCGAVHAFLYANGRMSDLGTLPSGMNSEGIAVNSSGQVTGWAEISNAQHTFFYQHAFLYSHGEMQDLGTLPGGSTSFGTAISDGWGRGENKGVRGVKVTGYSSTESGYDHAFLYSGGNMQDLGTLPGGRSSMGYAINRSGEVTGTSGTSGGDLHAFLYSRGAMQDLGTLPGLANSSGQGINDAGDIVGYCVNLFDQHAFLYKDGAMHDLQSMIPEDSGWVLEKANAINNDGQITGIGVHDGATRAFLLTPLRR